MVSRSGELNAKNRELLALQAQARARLAKTRTNFAEGSPVSLVGIVKDVTTHVVAEERLRRDLADKDLLSREIDHSIKNRMSMVGGMLRMQERAVS